MRDERNQGGTTHSETDEARGGSTPHIVRWILGISLLATIVLLSIIWITGAVSQGDIEEEANVSQIIRDTEDAQTERSDIDAVVNQDADRFAPENPSDMIQENDTDPARTIQN
jgi:hypothetical protein